MAAEEIDDLTSQAPPSKRARLETLNEMQADRPETMSAEFPDKMQIDGAENVASVAEPINGARDQLEKAEPTWSETDSLHQTTTLNKSTEVKDATAPANVTEVVPSPPLTHALEALLGGLDPTPPATQEIEGSLPVIETGPEVEKTTALGTDGATTAPPAGDPIDEEHPEWEVDSSPIESSSEDSSSEDSSSDESEDGDNAYKLLSPEEQARILMEGDGGSDDEGGDKGAKGSGGQLRTKNEVPEEVIPKPNVTITPEMPIEELGAVEGIVENTVLIKAKTSGEYKVLDSGSVLCLEDRSIIGVVSETIGRVQQPLYSVRFTNTEEIVEAGLSVGTMVFYSEQHSTYVFTQALKSFKGSDASNLHDEEVGDEEIEFSDDEAELEHKRRLKQKKIERRGGKQQNGGSSRTHPLQQQHTPGYSNGGISYDDAEDDGPYKPLSRPAGYADSVGRGEAPQEGTYSRGPDGSLERVRENGNMHNQRREQFRGRGRGDRGRGRADRGRGRGGYQDRRGGGSGFSLPPQGRTNGGYTPPQPSGFGPPLYQNAQSPTTGAPPNHYSNPLHQPYSPHQPQMPIWPQFPPQPQPAYQQQPYQQPFPNPQSGWPNMPSAPPLPSGAFINPAFFSGSPSDNPTQWGQQGQQGGRGRGGQQ